MKKNIFLGNRQPNVIKKNQGQNAAHVATGGATRSWEQVDKTSTPNDLPLAEQTSNTMDIGSAILIIGFAALVAAFLLLVIGLVYSELMNSDIPSGVANSGKLHMAHGLFVGIAIVVSICVYAYYFVFSACYWISYNLLYEKSNLLYCYH